MCNDALYVLEVATRTLLCIQLVHYRIANVIDQSPFEARLHLVCLFRLTAEYLTVQNSPVLFGCRTGLCGTCLVEIIGDITPPTEDEKEVLQILAPDNPNARLACQVDFTQDITIKTYEV